MQKKFRAWSKWDKKYWNGGGTFTFGENVMPSNWQDVYIIEQFAGPTDNGGTEVYQGDILFFNLLDNGNNYDNSTLWRDIYCPVIWDEKQCGFVVKAPNGEYIRTCHRKFRIAGNFHQHPELLEQS